MELQGDGQPPPAVHKAAQALPGLPAAESILRLDSNHLRQPLGEGLAFIGHDALWKLKGDLAGLVDVDPAILLRVTNRSKALREGAGRLELHGDGRFAVLADEDPPVLLQLDGSQAFGEGPGLREPERCHLLAPAVQESELIAELDAREPFGKGLYLIVLRRAGQLPLPVRETPLADFLLVRPGDLQINGRQTLLEGADELHLDGGRFGLLFRRRQGAREEAKGKYQRKIQRFHRFIF